MSTNVSSSAVIFTLVIDAFDISASSLETSEISVIRRSSRFTSSPIISLNFLLLSSVFAYSIVSIALRIDVNGFFNSCATSAAKLATASICVANIFVISLSDRERSPISSFRAERSGMSDFPPRLILSADRANLTTGLTIVLAKNKDINNVINKEAKKN